MTQAQELTPGGAPRIRRNLVSIVSEMLAVIDDAGGEVTARVDELELEIDDKVQAYRAVMVRKEADIIGLEAALQACRDEYEPKIAALKNQNTALKFRLEEAMHAVGVDKIKTATCTAYFQASKSVAIANEDAFAFNAPDRFIVTKHTPNRTEIKKALEAGEAVEGAELRTNRSLRFR